ncbi:LysR family transcriptional regulator [Lichenicola sp.]|uniref:LysR family transcriptional regulator n=1 Tax=Lichenicola sp. TaxID=2804529 RepID=UPI003B00DAC0
MTLEQLRIFVAVAEREHVTEAARALNLTQSAISNAIAALEERHAVRLFDRVGRGIVLNATGRSFLGEARGVLARAQAAEAALADMGGLRRGRLAIFASQTIAGYWLPRRLAAFHLRYPGIALDVAIGNTREAAAAVLEGAAELGFVEGEIDAPGLERSVIGVDRLLLLLPPDHPLAGKAVLSVAELRALTWVLRERGSGTRSSLEAALRAAGVAAGDLQVAMTLPSNEAVLAAAEAGAGATALSESVVVAALAAGRLARAGFDLPERSFRLLRHEARYRSKAADAFVAELG